MDNLCYFCFRFVMLLCVSVNCLAVTCWERVDILALDFKGLIVKLSLSHLYPGSGVVLDCIDS